MLLLLLCRQGHNNEGHSNGSNAHAFLRRFAPRALTLSSGIRSIKSNNSRLFTADAQTQLSPMVMVVWGCLAWLLIVIKVDSSLGLGVYMYI